MFRPIKEFAGTVSDFKVAPLGNSYVAYVGYPVAAGGTGHNKAVVTGASLSTTPLLGVTVAILGTRGNVLELDHVTAGSANETAATQLYFAQYIPSYLPIEYSVDLTAKSGTTTGSDGMCYFNTSATEGKLDETSVAFIAGTQGVFWSFGPDPMDSTGLTVIGHISRHT